MKKLQVPSSEKIENYETCSTEPPTSCSIYNESSELIERSVFENGKKEKTPFANKVSSSLIAMLQGVEVLCYFSILFIFKDNYSMHPATLNIMMCVIRLPWSFKLLWAIISDSFPLWGYRRKYYLLMGSFLCIVSTIALGMIEHNNIVLTTTLLTLYFLGSAVCNVIGEGQVVESGRNGTSANSSAKSISAFFAFRKLSFALMSYLSGYLLSVMTKKHIFLIGSILPMAVFISGFFTEEKKEFRSISLKKQVKYIYDIVRISHIRNAIIFIFIMMATPSCGNVLFYFMTNELKFTPEFLGKMNMLQSIANLLAILAYMLFFTKADIGKLLLYSTLIVTPFCLLPLIVVKRWNQMLYIPDSAFIVTDSVLMEFVGEFQTIPLLVLCSEIIPDGLESTIYSLLLTANNIASAISSVISSFLTYLLHITATDFRNLGLMIVICALTNLLPVFFLCLLPRRVRRENIPRTSFHNEAEYNTMKTQSFEKNNGALEDEGRKGREINHRYKPFEDTAHLVSEQAFVDTLDPKC